ncbi:MAG: hypothetical protein LCH54_13970 [Bacteroidetes bacterium]|nr:hypothetical protein [Bacteroidota bacterium]
MTRREIVLNKIHSLSEREVSAAIDRLTRHVKARLRFGSLLDRTKSGAHCEKNLGMKAVDYYVGESIKRLYEPNGWDWKFENLTITQQLIRIANKLISDKVAEYKSKKDDLPKFDNRDISEIYDLFIPELDDSSDMETIISKLIHLATEVSKDDEQLSCFTLRYFEGIKFETIAKDLGITIEQVYVLRKKLVRRLEKFKQELTA